MSENETKEKKGKETINRAWDSNEKLTYDMVLAHTQAVMSETHRIISNATTFTEKLNNEYLTNVQHHRDNDRKTLSFLYDVEIPEAVANAIIVKAAELLTKKTE